jgi:hypothetical protein
VLGFKAAEGDLVERVVINHFASPSELFWMGIRSVSMFLNRSYSSIGMTTTTGRPYLATATDSARARSINIQKPPFAFGVCLRPSAFFSVTFGQFGQIKQ